MIYFLSILFFLLITASSEKCHERNVIQVIGATKESSQNGYYYGIISTPNFPHPFTTPFNQTWVIDASHHPDGYQINVYLTQMYLIDGVEFHQYPTYKFCDQDHSRRNHGPRQDCRLSSHYVNASMMADKNDKLRDMTVLSTTCPYLEIKVTVPYLYSYHYRTRDPFLFYTYGFNITYEIVPEKAGVRNNSCYLRNCSNLGHCYIAENWRDFFCDCVKGHPGRYCDYSEFCDEARKGPFCSNGGKCKMFGSEDAYCDCEGTDYDGPKCEKLREPQASATTAKQTEHSLGERKLACSSTTSKGPCSCRPNPRNGRIGPDWMKYEAIISISPNYTTLRNQTTIGYEMQRNISNWFNQNSDLSNVSRVIVSFNSYRGNVSEMGIHFHGPSAVETVNSTLKQWLVASSTEYFRRKIPFMKDGLTLLTVPRIKFESIEVSKQTKLKIGKTVSITCTAITGTAYFSKRDIRFRWFKDNLPVNTSIATRHMSIGQMPTSNDKTMSILMIDQVSVYDGGTYTCEITDLEFGDQVCGEKEVDVILPPQIEVEPMSLTLEKQRNDRGIVITCTDGSHSVYNPNKPTDIAWYRSGMSPNKPVNDDIVVQEDIIPQGKLLRILIAENSQSYTCRGFNKDGEERSKIVEVRVLDSKNSPSCKKHWERLAKTDKSLLWEWTAPHSMAKIPCPKDYIGYVQRPCILTSSGKAQWGKSDFSRCISERLRRVNSTLQNTRRGFGNSTTSNITELIVQLEEYMSSSHFLYAGEGEKLIAILEDIVKYASEKKVNGLFPVLFRTVVTLLKIPNSCVEEKSVLTLCQIVVDMTENGATQLTAATKSKTPYVNSSDVLVIQTLPISAEASYRELSYLFPQKEQSNLTPDWLKDKVRVNFPLDSAGLSRDANSPLMYYLIMIAYKNLSSLLVPTDVVQTHSKKGYHTSIELISPVLQVSVPGGYYMPPDSHIKVHFYLSKEHRALVKNFPFASSTSEVASGTYFRCGVLDNTSVSTKTDYGKLRWSMNTCVMEVRHESFVECQCEDLGLFALLKVSNVQDEILQSSKDIPGIIVAGFSFCILSCVLSAVMLCIYLKCRISINTLYALKLFDCVFIFVAVFIILLGRTEMPSSSWLIWSASACSFLIASLSIQVTKALRVLLMEVKSDMPGFVFPWLRNVSQITLLLAITFSTVLPIWTGTVAKIIAHDTSNESAFTETSHVFVIFVGTVGLVVLAFLTIYYRAVLKTKRELNGYRQQNPTSSAPNTFTTDMIWMLTYRMKTLNRSLCLTLALLVMILGIILYENIRHSIYIQYFLTTSAVATGIVVLFSYVLFGEYPLRSSCVQTHSEKPLRRDPEKDSFAESNESQRKLYAISSDITGNGSVVGTTGLLPPPPPPILRNPTRLMGDDSETQSVSTVEEQSMDTFSTEVSFRAPPSHKVPVTSRRSSRSLRSGSNTVSSSGSSYRSRKNQSLYLNGDYKDHKPIRGTCLLSTGDYILPSNHNHNTSLGERSALPESSSTSSSSYNNYLPIRDNDEIQHKITRDLNILLQD